MKINLCEAMIGFLPLNYSKVLICTRHCEHNSKLIMPPPIMYREIG